MSGTLNLFKTNHPTYVLLLFCSAYIFKQTFAVPGSVFLNILAGALYGTWPGFILCSVLSGTGASLCYILANLVGSEAARFYFPERISSFEKKLEENQAELPFFLLFLRLFPMSPNWALNMASGVLGTKILELPNFYLHYKMCVTTRSNPFRKMYFILNIDPNWN